MGSFHGFFMRTTLRSALTCSDSTQKMRGCDSLEQALFNKHREAT